MAIITLSTMMIPLLEVISDRVVQTDGAERLEYWSAFQVSSSLPLCAVFMPPLRQHCFGGRNVWHPLLLPYFLMLSSLISI